MVDAGYPIRRLDDELIHIMSTALFNGMFETIRHDMPREKAMVIRMICGIFTPRAGSVSLEFPLNKGFPFDTKLAFTNQKKGVLGYGSQESALTLCCAVGLGKW